MTNTEAFVTFDHVSFSFKDRHIVRDLQISFNKGTSYALIGKSGTGKSTLLNLIAGFLKPNQGRILIGGTEYKNQREQTGFLFQDLGLFPWQTVLESTLMPIRLKMKRVNKLHYQMVLTLLREMELEKLLDKYPHELSGGQKQRVALARTLVGQPDLLLMDEPTSALDEMTKEQIQQLILRQQQKLKTTMFFVTHDIEEAVFLGERILILNDNGSIREIENPFFAVANVKEQIGFYHTCIEIRKMMNMENEDEHHTKNS